jgi:hypothetical protein
MILHQTKGNEPHSCSLLQWKAGQWRQLKDSNNAFAMRATTPLRIKGNDAIVTRATTPSWQRQGCLCIDNSNNAIVIRVKIVIATTAKTLRIDGNNAIATWVMTPARWQVARATTLAWQRRRLDCASTTAMTPSWQEQQLPSRQWQRCLHLNGGDASLPTSDEGNDIDDDDDAIAMRAMTPAWGRQQHNHNKGNNTLADQGQQCHCYKEGNTISTTTGMPAHQQRQQSHQHAGNSCNGNNGKYACALMATTPSQWGQ